MATFEHLVALNDGTAAVDKDLFRNKVGAAAGIVAQTVNSNPVANPTDATGDTVLQGHRKELAAKVVTNGPEWAGNKFFWAVILANDTAAISAIRDAPDKGTGSILDAVEGIWDLIAESSANAA